MALLARTGTKLASGATSKAAELLRRLGPGQSHGTVGSLLTPAARPFSATSGWYEKSWDEEFNRQKLSYNDFFAREKEKADIRHQEYLRNYRHIRIEKNFEEMRKAVERLDKGMQSGFKGVSEEFVKMKESLKEELIDAHEASSEDLLYLVLCLELMADELKDRLDLLQLSERVDVDIGQQLLDYIPKVKMYYFVAFGIKVALDAGVTPSDLPNIAQEIHVQSVEKLKEKLQRYHKK